MSSSVIFLRAHRLWMPALLICVLASPLSALAQSEGFCATEDPGTFDFSAQGVSDLGNDVRAIVVFIRFKDETQAWPERWPHDPNAAFDPAPQFHVLSESPSNPESFPDSTLSALFYEQTKHSPSPHLLYGDVWPRDVAGNPTTYETKHETAWYYKSPYNPDASRGFGWLTREILDSLTVDPRFDIADYDRNGDGVVDQIFMILRNDGVWYDGEWYRSLCYVCGVSDLRGVYGGAGFPPENQDGLQYVSPSNGKTYTVSWSRSGSYTNMRNWHHNRQQFGILAHEYGHDLFPGLGHLTPVLSNEVPTNEGYNAEGRRINNYDYNMMGGNPYNYSSGGGGMSEHERALGGWSVAIPLINEGAYELGPHYSTGDAYKLELIGDAQGRVIYLINKQKVGYYMVGLAETGLFAELAVGNRI